MKLHFKLSILLAVLGALMVVPVFASSASVNIPNGGFETGNFAGWSAGQGWKVVSGGAYQGKYSAKITLSGGTDLFGSQSWLCSQPSPITPRSVRFSVAFRHNGNGRGYGGLVVRYLDSKQNRLYDSTYLLTDNYGAKQWFVPAATDQYDSGQYAQFCVQAVAYQGKTYTISVDAVSIGQ